MIVLVVGGLDPSGGAGILQDARTIEELGARAMAVATAWTVQSSHGVEGWEPAPAGAVARQIHVLLQDFPVRAVKVGMIGTADHADAIAETLDATTAPIVLDPVLGATEGGALSQPSVLHGVERLLAAGPVITPNLDEAEALLDQTVRDLRAMRDAAEDLVSRGARAALVKGGHLPGAPRDVLADGEGIVEFGGERIGGASVHGTGCVLASALGFFLGSGLSVRHAAKLARTYLEKRLQGAERLGSGPLSYL